MHEAANPYTFSPGEGNPLLLELPPGTRLAYAPDWGFFIQNSSNRERLSHFRPSADEALTYFIEQGPEKVY
jgi:hypothetical protein